MRTSIPRTNAPHKVSLRPITSCAALLIALVAPVAAAKSAQASAAPQPKAGLTTQTGFLSFTAAGKQLRGRLQIPRVNLDRRFPDPISPAEMGAALAQDFSLVADGQFCKVRWLNVERAASATLVEWELNTDCPARPERLDAHFSPFGQKQPQYRTLVTWHLEQNVQYALSTANEACVGFTAEPRWQQLVEIAVLPALIDTVGTTPSVTVNTIPTRKPVNSGR
ncbi:hypothetical protein C7S18_04865 [Ahniella affigens]|uniref:Toxin co-regulated pilus biosynthesis protein Q C-terminal domain-containing protein n=1 Tax=Ahniella affigens TaxID=2021234 RepID=A0A2P1PP02_9GAMM|nr:hypothetical protein [Ahniella affigens]AVP96573.1 hypothetical protein C7S18_04865 [Ahniella affigens]